jgi:hypothetical protein
MDTRSTEQIAADQQQARTEKIESLLRQEARSVMVMPPCADGECENYIVSLTLDTETNGGSIRIVTSCSKCRQTLEAAVKISGTVIDYAYTCQSDGEPFDWSRLNPSICGDCSHDPHRPGCCAHCKCGELGVDAGTMRRMQATLDRATNLDAEIVDAAVLFVQARVARAKAQDARNEILNQTCTSAPADLPCFSASKDPETYCARCRRAAEFLSAFRAASALQRKHARKLQKLVEKRAR